MRKTNIFIISGPSGVGKDSIIKGLKKVIPVKQLVTTVSRLMRQGEKQGKPYYFITRKEFIKKIKQNEFFEYNEHYSNYYGLTWEEINKAKEKKEIRFWQTEYHGVIAAKKRLPEICAIFIDSPLEVLVKRMKRREKKIDEKIFKQRIHDVKIWIKHLDIYDYVIENKEGKLDETIKKVVNIIKKRGGKFS